MALGKTLKALRQKQNLNQKALSALSGVSQATISRIETGRVRQLRSAALKSLADAMGVSADFLMGDSEVFAEIPAPGTQAASTIPGVREDRFRQIADLLDGFLVHERGRVLYTNQSFADALGYRREELLGKNGVELITAPQSRATVQRLLNAVSADSCEALFVRKDKSVFPVELLSRNLTESVRLIVTRDITDRRCQQAALRLQEVGLDGTRIDSTERVVRVLSDELEDMGVSFEAASIVLIDEQRDRLIAFVAYPESRGYRDSRQEHSLQKLLGQSAALRGLVSNWRRRKTWVREAEEDFLALVRDSHPGSGLRPELLVDVPFCLGCLGVGLPATSSVRIEALTQALTALAPAVSCVVKRLVEIEDLNERLRTLTEQAAARQAL